jgi:hypothetical protein
LSHHRVYAVIPNPARRPFGMTVRDPLLMN